VLRTITPFSVLVAFAVLWIGAGRGTAVASTPGAPASQGSYPRTIRVPQDQATLEGAIEASTPGTMILLDRGTYRGDVTVPETKSGIAIRGVDRNEVVFDGQDVRSNAIVVQAESVVLENMTAHNFVGNGFYWVGADGYAGRYLTVWNVGLYGIYAIESSGGIFEQSYVSGAADAAFYIGECNPCDAVVTNVTGRLSAVGYSGTNAGGNLEVRDSLWEQNGTAIMPNSFDGLQAPAPQRSSTISGNTIGGSGSVPVPANSPLAGYFGMGIAIAGGWENLVEGNEISGSANYGIALFPTVQREGPEIHPKNNVVRGNTVSGSGKADLALAQGSAETNCFADNIVDSTLPAALEAKLACGQPAATDGDADVLADLGVPSTLLLDRLGERPSYTEMPAPDDQPSMPGVDAPATPTVSAAAPSQSVRPTASAPSTAIPGGNPAPLFELGLLAAILVVGVVVAAILVIRTRRPG
jgi:hypothetical protein